MLLLSVHILPKLAGIVLRRGYDSVTLVVEAA